MMPREMILLLSRPFPPFLRVSLFRKKRKWRRLKKLDEKLIQGQQQRLVVFIPRYQFASHILFSPASITPLQRTMSFVAQILQPGGGLLLIPFIRSVIMCLFMLTVTAFVAGVARIHMAILASLAGGLLLSISFFMGEYVMILLYCFVYFYIKKAWKWCVLYYPEWSLTVHLFRRVMWIKMMTRD